MAQVDESTAGRIERVVPAVRVLVPERLLDPLEHLEERLELYLAVGQVNLLEASFVAFPPTLGLFENKRARIIINTVGEGGRAFALASQPRLKQLRRR